MDLVREILPIVYLLRAKEDVSVIILYSHHQKKIIVIKKKKQTDMSSVQYFVLSESEMKILVAA